MTAAPAHISPGRAPVCPFLVCRKPKEVVDFAEATFDARLARPILWHRDGRLWNAELNFPDGGTVMVGEATEGMERPGFVYLHVHDTDATFARALKNGATEIMAPQSQFYGDYDGGVQDMGGNWWWIATHERDMTHDEIEAEARTAEEARKEGPQ